jgi:hypothetical protein
VPRVRPGGANVVISLRRTPTGSAPRLGAWGVRRLCGLTLREAGEQAGGLEVFAGSKLILQLEQRATVGAVVLESQGRIRELAKVQP